MDDLLVVGGGIAGLAAAGVAARAGLKVTLIEQAAGFAEVGAGIQLGPNAVRVLSDWGLDAELREIASFPDELRVRSATSGASLGRLALGAAMRSRYRQPYATVHRADLHRLLLERVQPLIGCRSGERLLRFDSGPSSVGVETGSGAQLESAALLGCDGLWSRVRAQLLADGEPVFCGDLAYRGLVPAAGLPAALRANAVTAWLAPGLHAVQYPVRGGEAINLVVIVAAEPPPDREGWDQDAHLQQLRRSLGAVHAELDALIAAVPQWRLWPLNARPAMRGPHEQARGRVALLGDAAHPMRPYLAQGAAMALEDAWTLGRLLEAGAGDWPRTLQRLAQARWRRNAWVQDRSRRNGLIFHACGPLRWGRDLAMGLLGSRVIDVPRLYSGPPALQ